MVRALKTSGSPYKHTSTAADRICRAECSPLNFALEANA